MKPADPRTAVDDRVIIAIYNDGEPEFVARAIAALPHRTKSAIQQRASGLRKLGLIIGGRKTYPKLSTTRTAELPAVFAPPRPAEERPLRCPGCMKVFFPSDSLPIRASA